MFEKDLQWLLIEICWRFCLVGEDQVFFQLKTDQGQAPSIGLTLGHAGNFVPPWKKCHNWKLLQILKGSVLFFGMDGLSWSWINEKHVQIKIMFFS